MRSLVGIVVLLGLMGPGCVDEPPEPGLYLRGATILTGTGEPPIGGSAVVIRGGRIVAVEPETDRPGERLEVVDLDGLTLVPGLIDAHVHIAITEDSDLQEPLDVFLDHGITTIRDLGGPLERLLDLRNDLEAGRAVGPRLSVCGPMITAPGGHPVVSAWQAVPWMREHACRELDDEEDAREEVRRLAEAGVDFLKAIETDCPWPLMDACPRLDGAVLGAIGDEATRNGLDLAVHTDRPDDVEAALAAGASSIEHGVTEGELTPELATLVAASGAYWVTTSTKIPGYTSSAIDDIVPRLALLRGAGARVGVGTDSTSTIPRWGMSYYRELRYLVQAGYTPLEALSMGTSGNAELLGRSDELGSIQPGRLADLVAVEGDPLENFLALTEIRLVVLNGEIVRRGPPPTE